MISILGIARRLVLVCYRLFGHEGVPAAVAVALEADESSVVDGAVDDRGGHVGVAEHAGPSAELDVGGVDDAPCLVAVRDDLEEQAAAFLVDGDVAELVEDDEPGLADHGELPVEPVVLFGSSQTHDQAGRSEEPHRYPVPAGGPSEGDGEVRLAGADGPVEHEVLVPVDEPEAFELGSAPVRGHREVVPVIIVEGLVGREPGGLQQSDAFGGLPAGDLGLEPSFDEVELGGRGLGQRLGQHAPGEGQMLAQGHDVLALGDGVGPAALGLRDSGFGSRAHSSSFPGWLNLSYLFRSGRSSP